MEPVVEPGKWRQTRVAVDERMSTQTIIERPLVNGLSGEKSARRIKRSSKKMLSRRKPIIIEITGFVILGMAAFYFWRNQTSKNQSNPTRLQFWE
jgi:hypothetical protein